MTEQKTSAPPTPANAALQYVPDAYDARRPQVKGIHSAGDGFLTGFVRHSGVGQFVASCTGREQFMHFTKRIEGLAGEPRKTLWAPPWRHDLLSAVGAVHSAGPGIAALAWERRHLSNRAYSVTGLTHTLSSITAAEQVFSLYLAPTQSWDALVCTSRAARNVVSRLLDGCRDYVEDRFGVARPPASVQLPIIPLGVDCARLDPGRPDGPSRAELRQRLGIAEDEVLALFYGRLSFHAKAHPVPMFRAANEARRRSGVKLRLAMFGQFFTPAIEGRFREAAARYCPDMPVDFIAGTDRFWSDRIWHAADIFVSLSDNIQETFGLTVIEAMAAGLPCIVSDWDGYRDTVEHGVTGFAVPTRAPAPGAGHDLAFLHQAGGLTYDQFIGAVSLATAVDPEGCVEAFVALARDPGLRRRMGEAGRHRAKNLFDWATVVGAYQELWRELGERRARDTETAPRRADRAADPTSIDPFTLFSEHPTAVFGPEALEDEPAPGAAERIDALIDDKMVRYVESTLLDSAELRAMAQGRPLGSDPKTPGLHRQRALRSAGWMKKFGLRPF
jgi:glycosyltransferase involved in cell wall biosynthesis